MEVGEISDFTQAQIQQKFQVAVLKKAIDSQGEASLSLIDNATSTKINPPGVGEKLNVTA